MIPIAAVILAGIAGAIVVPLLTLLYHFIFFHETLNDGQYPIALLIASLQGAVLGSVAGLIFGIWTTGKRRLAARVAKVGGLVLTLVFFALGWGLMSGTDSPTLGQRVWSTLYSSLIPMIGSIALTRFDPGDGG